jgi:hypothetical protein
MSSDRDFEGFAQGEGEEDGETEEGGVPVEMPAEMETVPPLYPMVIDSIGPSPGSGSSAG